jgi:hypothetical protein
MSLSGIHGNRLDANHGEKQDTAGAKTRVMPENIQKAAILLFDKDPYVSFAAFHTVVRNLREIIHGRIPASQSSNSDNGLHGSITTPY